MKKYKYETETQTISFKVAMFIPEKGTAIRDRLFECFFKLLEGKDLTKTETDWCNGVLNP